MTWRNRCGAAAGVASQRVQDGRHGEQVGDAVPGDEGPGLGRVEPVGRGQHARGAPGDLSQRVDTGAVRQRGDDERNVVLGGAGHEVAQVVRDDEGELPVGEDAGLGAAGGAGGVEEPGRVVAVHVGQGGRGRVGLGQRVPLFAHVDRDAGGRASGGVGGERGVEQVHGRAGGLREVGDLGRGEADVGGHEHGADGPAGPERFEQRPAVAGMDEHAVAAGDAAGEQAGRGIVDPALEGGPGPDVAALDQGGVVREASGRLAEKGGEVAGGDHGGSIRRPDPDPLPRGEGEGRIWFAASPSPVGRGSG